MIGGKFVQIGRKGNKCCLEDEFYVGSQAERGPLGLAMRAGHVF